MRKRQWLPWLVVVMIVLVAISWVFSGGVLAFIMAFIFGVALVVGQIPITKRQ